MMREQLEERKQREKKKKEEEEKRKCVSIIYSVNECDS